MQDSAALSNEDIKCVDRDPADDAEQFIAEHHWRLAREPKLLQRLMCLIVKRRAFIILRDAQGKPVRLEPSYPLLEIMAELAR